MRRGFFLSFLIFSCVQVLSVLALEDLHKLENQDLKASKHLMAMKETKEPSGNENVNNDAEDFAAKQYAVFPERSQKAKGSYGGANLVHHRPGEKSAAPVLRSSSVLISTSTMCISLFFLPVFPLQIV